MGASNMAEYNFIRDELYSHLQATLAMSGAIFIRDSLGMEAIPDELASLIREWASGDVRTAYWSRVDPLCPDNSRAVERWNALSSLRKPKGPFEG